MNEPEELSAADEEQSSSVQLSNPFAAYNEQQLDRIDFLRRTFGASPFAYVITDHSLRILWENAAYRELFSLAFNRENARIETDFPRSFTDEDLTEAYRALTSAESRYAYHCQIESFHPSRLSVLANLQLTPLFISGETSPKLFLGSFDDVTGLQRGLLQNTFISLLEASKLKDNDTGQHIQRVSEYSRLIAEHLFGLDEYEEVNREFVSLIAFLATMHDVGKIGTPDDILNKEGALDEREWEVMQEHTINGAYILSSYPNQMARHIALFHHEMWDGKGYPYQFTGEMIPLPARIVAITDVYDALRMSRSYKEAFSHEKAMKIMREKAGSHFDPHLFRIFSALEATIEEVYERLKDA